MFTDASSKSQDRNTLAAYALAASGWWERDGQCLRLTFLAGLFVYFYPLSNYSLHIDSELQAVLGDLLQTVLLGRWGTALLHATLLPEPAVPYLTPLLSLGAMTLAAVETARIVGLQGMPRQVFAALYVGLPQFAYQLEFANQSECVALGILCSTFGYGVFLGGGIRRRGAALLLGVFGLSFYQSIVFVVPTICTIRCLYAVQAGRAGPFAVLRAYAEALVFVVAGHALCTVIARLARRHFHLPPSGYLDQMVGWYQLPFGAALDESIRGLLRAVGGGLFYGNGVFLLAIPAAATVALLPAARPRLSLLVTILALGALAAPFVIVLLLGAVQPPRTYVAAPVAFAGLLALALGRLQARPAVVVAIVAAILVSDCFCVSRLFYADTMALASDRLLGSRITTVIYRSVPDFDPIITPVYFHGAYVTPNIWRGPDFDVFGASFFSWDGGNPVRIAAFLKAAGFADLRLANAAEVSRVRATTQALPRWPNPGAIRLIDGVLVVKLGA